VRRWQRPGVRAVALAAALCLAGLEAASWAFAPPAALAAGERSGAGDAGAVAPAALDAGAALALVLGRGRRRRPAAKPVPRLEVVAWDGVRTLALERGRAIPLHGPDGSLLAQVLPTRGGWCAVAPWPHQAYDAGGRASRVQPLTAGEWVRVADVRLRLRPGRGAAESVPRPSRGRHQ
jgi:hypothetical protein